MDNDIGHAGGGGLLLQHTTAAPQQCTLVQSFRTAIQVVARQFSGMDTIS